MAGAAETLYNGIEVSEGWQTGVTPGDRTPQPIPYLEPSGIPKVILIDIGRQLFFDDFLIAETNGVVRKFYKPVKFTGNPLFWPESENELALNTSCKGVYPDDTKDRARDPKYNTAPSCAMPGGGLWWDPMRRRFRMWYLAGWSGVLSTAESEDGFRWTRPKIDAKGLNSVKHDAKQVDTFSVVPDYSAENPFANWRLYVSSGGEMVRGREYVSTDGYDWKFVARTGFSRDSTTLFYNPFRNVWVWSLKGRWPERARCYHEHADFVRGAAWTFPEPTKVPKGVRIPHNGYSNTVDVSCWMACDSRDVTRLVGRTERVPQFYNFDAVAYESIMLGYAKILCGRDNAESAKVGLPKTTTVHFAYSRDGYHFDRPDRTPAIPDSGWGSGEWDTGYVTPCAGGLVVRDDRLWVYYTGFRGDATLVQRPFACVGNGMHANACLGVASLRRDGFAGLVADGEGSLLTRPVRFSGSHFFVNANARFGKVAVEVTDEDGKVIDGYSLADCRALERTDSTKAAIVWKGGDLSALAGRAVRFRFALRVSTLYSFWVSKWPTGESGGYLGAGGPEYKGLRDCPEQEVNNDNKK